VKFMIRDLIRVVFPDSEDPWTTTTKGGSSMVSSWIWDLSA
jgi:hypothetical protein